MTGTKLFRSTVNTLIGASLIILLTSYGNSKVHPGINEIIVRSFINKVKDPATRPTEFKYYYFNLDLLQQCKGIAVTKSGFFQPADIVWINRNITDKIQDTEGNLFDLATLKATTDESAAEKSVTEWIAHGGFSADEPELPASLRHFYDPTAPEGKRYLTDITNAKLMGALQRMLKNPEMDGVEWALGKPGDLSFSTQEHSYTWEKGKGWMKMALQEKDENKRSEHMGKAWRSLGETLHMIADNGCPPHVRNDAHPSPLCNYNVIFGNPDPYEEIVDIIRRDYPDDFLQYFRGSPDRKLMDKLKELKTARGISHELAVFTNTNFVTGETISGMDKKGNTWQQIINPTSPYHSPLLQNMNYDENTGTYTSMIGDNPVPVKQCVDKMYWVDRVPEICYSYITFECVESQARVLLPNVVEAGRKVMELFIPKLKIEIKSAENGRVAGVITHETDPEYTSEIKYSGNATLFFKDKKFRKKGEKVVEVKNGQFDISGLDFENGDKVYARIDFGGIGVESQDVLCSSGKETDIIYGRYGGECREYINKEAILSLGLKPGNDENTKAANYMKKFENEAYIESYGKSGGENPRPFFIDILPTDLNDNTVDVRNLRYVIKSRSNSCLSPKKDGSNGQVITTYTSNSFKVIVKDKNVVTEYNGTFSGDKLSGGYTVTREGKETVKGVFNTRLEAKF